MTTMNEQQQELNERIADDERHAATMRKARDYDALMARAEAAEAERNDANTEAARLKEAGRMVQEEVTAWRDSYEALNEQRLALAARVAELEAEAARLRQELEVQQGRAKTLLNRNSAQAARMRALLARAEAAEAEVVDLHRQLAEMAAAMEEIEDERLALAARVAELEAQLAAQGWRPVTEDWPPYGVQHLGRAMLDSPTMLVTRTTDDGDEVWQDTDGLLFYAGNIRYCAVIPPDATEARVAELETKLAAQQWRPVTEDWPPYNERVIIGHGGGYGGGWSAFARRVRTDNRDGDDWLMDDDTTLAFESAVVAMRRPLPPAPQETE